MEKETKRRIRITIMGIVGLLLLVVGISFAAFNADLSGTREQTMRVGCLKVDMVDNGALNMENALPEKDEAGLREEPYVFTITNSCTTDAYYETTLNVMDTSNMDNTTKVKVALGGDSYLAPTFVENLPTTELLDDSVTGVSSTYKIDEGFLQEGKSKTFELRTWFDYDVEEIEGILESKIIINSTANNTGIIYNKNTTGYYAVSKNQKLSGVNYGLIAPSANQSSGVVEMKNDNGDTTYHFRGTPNNYVTFGNANVATTYSYTNGSGTKVSKTYNVGDSFKWRILSTNSDGSVNLILDDIIGETTFANAENTLNTFYSTHLSDESFYINENKTFCIEKTSSEGIYLAQIRVTNNNPTNKCESAFKFTKVGLATVDDLMFAGGVYNTANKSFYLYKNSKGFMVSSHSDDNKIYSSTSSKSIEEITTTVTSGVRPVITLATDTKLSGEGTQASPFYVSGKYNAVETQQFSDLIAPTIDYARVDAKWSKENKIIEISANDNLSGSGIMAYIVKTTSTKPSLDDDGWEVSTTTQYKTVNSYDNGTYYVFVRDGAGNISEPKKLVINSIDKVAPTCTITINPSGTETDYKTLSITSDESNIDLHGYSWDDTDVIEDVRKVTENDVYTAHIKDLAGNEGSCSAVVTSIIPPVYSWSTSTVSIGDNIDSISGYTSDYTNLNQSYFLKHNIGVNNTVKSNEICYVVNETLYCLKLGAENLEKNKETLFASFGEDNCYVSSSGVDCPSLYYVYSGINNISIMNAAGFLPCSISDDGSSICSLPSSDEPPL